MYEEMESKKRNNTWNLCTLPEKKTKVFFEIIKWLFKLKTNEKGEIKQE